MHVYSGGHHRCQELAVVDLIVVPRVQALERLYDGLILQVELRLQDLLEFGQLHCPCAVDVQLDEGRSHLGSLVVGQRPRHHRHARLPEGGRAAESAQGIDCGLVEDALLHLVALHDPWVLQRGLRGQTYVRIHHQQLLHELLAIRRHLAPDVLLLCEAALLDATHLELLAPIEGHVPEEHDEDCDAKTPHVTLRRVAVPENFWRNVRQGSTAGRHLRVRLPDLTEPEINQLQMVACWRLEQEVFQLDVPMYDAVRVNVVQREQHLPGHIRGILLGKALLLDDALEKLAAGHALHD
mmetsp:Transcript_46861/g.135040  ORF Transcript_46861/g.135040 Transcript_46861/m.135040 type:complete len:296 (+) Transcript_46861:558-1445(+)